MAPKKQRLTNQEKRLLRFPPTQTTWECLGTFDYLVYTDGNTARQKQRCGMLNPGSAATCVVCGKTKSRRPKLIYPAYLAACKKAGIEPGERWRESAVVSTAPRRPVRRKK